MLTMAVVGAAAARPTRPEAQEPDAGAVAATAVPQLPRLAIRPVDTNAAYVSVTLEPGSQARIPVELANLGESTVEARTYAADAYSLANGGFGVRSGADFRTGPTTWLEYPTRVLALNPGQAVIQSVTITVPNDTPPGEYVSALVIENAEPVSAGVSGGGIRFQQILRQAIAVAITVPGTFTPQLEFGAVRYLTDNYQPLLELAVRNTGNVHLRLRGTLSVQVPTGEPVVQIPVELDTIYAGTATTITVSLPKPLTPGEYRVRAVFEDPDRGFVTTTAAPLPFFVVATAAPAPSAPLSLSLVRLEPIHDATDDRLLFIDCRLTLVNPGPPLTNARVIVEVSHDGMPLEEIELGSSLTLSTGNAELRGRYIPRAGWQPGTYAFIVRVEGIPNPTEPPSILLRQPVPTTITVDDGNA
ncbi:MAG: hypothetical protein C4346_11690 [Chloroflexota bacterium]